MLASHPACPTKISLHFIGQETKAHNALNRVLWLAGGTAEGLDQSFWSASGIHSFSGSLYLISSFQSLQ